MDKLETRKFIQEALEGVVDTEEFNEEAFEEVFEKVDDDKSGTVDKNEMLIFVRRMFGTISKTTSVKIKNIQDT